MQLGRGVRFVRRVAIAIAIAIATAIAVGVVYYIVEVGIGR